MFGDFASSSAVWRNKAVMSRNPVCLSIYHSVVLCVCVSVVESINGSLRCSHVSGMVKQIKRALIFDRRLLIVFHSVVRYLDVCFLLMLMEWGCGWPLGWAALWFTRTDLCQARTCPCLTRDVPFPEIYGQPMDSLWTRDGLCKDINDSDPMNDYFSTLWMHNCKILPQSLVYIMQCLWKALFRQISRV